MIATRASTDAKPDTVLAKAVDVARSALVELVGAEDVGDHVDHVAEGERVVTHRFACRRPGYRGWSWSVTVTRAYRMRQVTVDEIVLMPGEDAIVAPPWVPWKDRVRPGDLSPGDVLPVAEDDHRLVPTYSFGDDPLDADAKAQIRQVAKDLGLGRSRTLSAEGHREAAQRWYDGESGPNSSLAKSAPASCVSCGFLIRLSGSLAESFGVCANAQANDDGRVVAFGHGCGAHSEVQLAKKHLPQALPDPVWDTVTTDEIESF